MLDNRLNANGHDERNIYLCILYVLRRIVRIFVTHLDSFLAIFQKNNIVVPECDTLMLYAYGGEGTVFDAVNLNCFV